MDSDTPEKARRRLEAIERLATWSFSPEMTARIDPDAPEVIGGPGLPKRRMKPQRS